MTDPKIVPIGPLHSEWDSMPQWMRKEYALFHSLTRAKPTKACIKTPIEHGVCNFTINGTYNLGGVDYSTLAVITYAPDVLPQVALGFAESIFELHTLHYLPNTQPRAIHVVGCRTGLLKEVQANLIRGQATGLHILQLISVDDSFRRFERDRLVSRTLTINDTRRIILHPSPDGFYTISRRIFFQSGLWQFSQLGDSTSLLLVCSNDTITLYRNAGARGRPRNSNIVFSLPIKDGVQWMRESIGDISVSALNDIIHWLSALTNKPE